MNTPSRTCRCLLHLVLSLSIAAVGVSASLSAAEEEKPKNILQRPQEILEVAGHRAFVILPQEKNRNPHRPMPWVWYAPTLPNLPAVEETWMFERFMENGIAIAGVDEGESYGNPAGREGFTALYRELTENRGFSRKPCLLARSRGGLMLYNWTAGTRKGKRGLAAEMIQGLPDEAFRNIRKALLPLLKDQG